MSTVISFAITDQELRTLEDASRREGVDLLKEASKLFALGLKANQLLEKDSATTGSSTGDDVVAAFERNISFDLHATLKRAAELQGRTMTDFVVSAVQDAAQKAIEQAEVIRLSLADQQCFAQVLLNPPEPAQPMLRAFARRADLLKPT